LKNTVKSTLHWAWLY